VGQVGHGIRQRSEADFAAPSRRSQDGERTRLTDNSLYAPMEPALRTLVDAGFSPKLSMVALSTIYSYAVGFVIEEQAVFPRPGVRDEFYGPQQRGRRIDGEKFPLAHQAGDLFSNFDRHFEEGLKLIMAGIAAQRPAKRRRN
jgi:TetR/AcrR family transcriptional regulator, tetracycline repressor protein